MKTADDLMKEYDALIKEAGQFRIEARIKEIEANHKLKEFLKQLRIEMGV